jgi:hypothetical protein
MPQPPPQAALFCLRIFDLLDPGMDPQSAITCAPGLTWINK